MPVDLHFTMPTTTAITERAPIIAAAIVPPCFLPPVLLLASRSLAADGDSGAPLADASSSKLLVRVVAASVKVLPSSVAERLELAVVAVGGREPSLGVAVADVGVSAAGVEETVAVCGVVVPALPPPLTLAVGQHLIVFAPSQYPIKTSAPSHASELMSIQNPDWPSLHEARNPVSSLSEPAATVDPLVVVASMQTNPLQHLPPRQSPEEHWDEEEHDPPSDVLETHWYELNE